MRFQIVAMMMTLSLTFAATAWGDEQGAAAKSASPAKAASEPDAAANADQAKRFQQFEETLADVKLVGHFTILGKDGPLRKEEYTIKGVKKLPTGDAWLFTTRIKYGENDVQVPLPLDVQWAGTTPVITLTDFTVPGLGTFSARVVIYRNKYAGTWSHGNVGGHLFGTIEKNVVAAEVEEAEASTPSAGGAN